MSRYCYYNYLVSAKQQHRVSEYSFSSRTLTELHQNVIKVKFSPNHWQWQKCILRIIIQTSGLLKLMWIIKEIISNRSTDVSNLHWSHIRSYSEYYTITQTTVLYPGSVQEMFWEKSLVIVDIIDIGRM